MKRLTFPMKLILTVALVCTLSGISSSLQHRLGSNGSVQPNGPSKELKLVGRADGKSYYAEYIEKNWFESSEYCKINNMTLATITSGYQWLALLEGYDEPDFYYGHWTAGRDSHELRQFSWDETSSEVTGSYLNFEVWTEIQYQTCLAYNSLGGNASYLFYYHCLDLGGVLCEKVE